MPAFYFLELIKLTAKQQVMLLIAELFIPPEDLVELKPVVAEVEVEVEVQNYIKLVATKSVPKPFAAFIQWVVAVTKHSVSFYFFPIFAPVSC